MKKLVIKGGRALQGEITVGGCKNAAVAILPATLLTEEPCIIENVPDVSDVRIIIEILRKLGAECRWESQDTLYIDTKNVNSYRASYEIISRMRGSYYFIGSLLGRFGHAEVALPGGCDFGTRPIDMHLKGFLSLGATIKEEYGMVNAHTEHGLKGNSIYLDKVSVGATINIMLAAARAQGVTTIENCAREPHVVDLANFLNSMGANVRGAGTDVIKIKGVESLHGSRGYSVIPDQIEAGTYMIASAATKGDVTVRNVIPRHMESLTAKLEEMNIGVEEGADYIRIFYNGDFHGTNVKTLPYPGFPTDLQPQITVLLALAQGDSTVTEAVWDNRFRYVSELRRMGADIKVEGSTAIVYGPKKFKGTSIRCTDLRAGAAMVIAALASCGQSELYDIKYIDRGYADIEGKLSALGADIRREEAEWEPI